MHITYIIRCMDNSFYTGYTTDINRRVEEHKTGINSKYTKVKGFKNLEVYFISESRSSAMKLEYHIKKYTRNKKQWIINNPEEFVNELNLGFNYSVGV